jgi:hypothetical protein
MVFAAACNTGTPWPNPTFGEAFATLENRIRSGLNVAFTSCFVSGGVNLLLAEQNACSRRAACGREFGAKCASLTKIRRDFRAAGIVRMQAIKVRLRALLGSG